MVTDIRLEPHLSQCRTGVAREVRACLTWCSLLVLLLSLIPVARAVERGLPLIEVYGRQQHGGGTQSYALAQDAEGIMWFANLGGLLSYDGTNWNSYHLDSGSAIFAVRPWRDHHVAVGGFEEFGWFAPDARGELSYRSLSSKLPPELRGFGDVLEIFAVPTGLVFVTAKQVFLWRDATADLVVIGPQLSQGDRAFLVGEEMYLRHRQAVYRLGVGGELALLASGSWVPDIEQLLAGPDGRLLLVVAGAGLASLDRSGRLEQWLRGSADQWLAGYRTSGAVQAGAERWVIGTHSAGLAVVDSRGELEQIIDSSVGLPDDNIHALLLDREGSLWVAMDSSIARIEVQSTLSVVDRRSGLRGTAQVVREHAGSYWVGSGTGLYRLRETPVGFVAEAIAGVPARVWDLLPLGETLLAATSDGVFAIRGEEVEQLPGSAAMTVYCLLASTSDPERIWVGSRSGISHLAQQQGQWRMQPLLPGSPAYARGLIEREGVLWAGTVFDGLVSIRDWQDGAAAHIDRIPLFEVTILEMGGEIHASSQGEFYRLDATRSSLQKDQVLTGLAEGEDFHQFWQDQAGNLWLNTLPIRRAAPGSAGDWQVTTLPAIDASYVAGFAAGDAAVWILTDNGLFHYRPAEQRLPAVVPRPRIGRVTLDEEVLFGGFGETEPPILEHGFRRLRLEFGSGTFHRGALFSYKLEPTDADWSDWSPAGAVDFTNLDQAAYRFLLRIKGSGPGDSAAREWRFSVAAPWYSSYWAVALWVLLALLGARLLADWRSKSLLRQAAVLRGQVAERTQVLRETVGQLHRARDELSQRNQQLERANRKLQEISRLDELTGIANRRCFLEFLDQEWRRAQRGEYCLTLALIDLDHFKAVNDSYGHATGDEYLRRFAGLLQGFAARQGDLAARYGGEEFVLILALADLEAAVALCERLRAQLAALGLVNEASPLGVLTASIGVAARAAAPGAGPDELVQAADRALYRAKEAGRNRVCTLYECIEHSD